MKRQNGFGTAPVFFTAISTILGAILFLRFGFSVGTVGFLGTVLIVVVGHLVTIPTALALSEIATNQKVEGGGEYFIISRSFGLNIGTTIGIALYLSQAISVAFYVIAFTEAFEPVFNWLASEHSIYLPRQAVSLPVMGLLSLLILTKGANLGVKALYFVVAILFVALIAFFAGKPISETEGSVSLSLLNFRGREDFFLVFAIIFPAFTGMTAGVGLSGDLRKPGKSIPIGTISATFIGMIVYVFIAWKLAVSADQEALVNRQLVMGEIALYGWILIPLGLAASTISSALGSIMVAPRTLQAIASDRSFPYRTVNYFFAKGKGKQREPVNASLITVIIAFAFVALGNVDAVARIISMFFMVTYGSLCLISFLYHFGSDPSYRPTFRSRWYLSLFGFIMCLWLMFKMDTLYAALAILVMVLLYNAVTYIHKDRRGIQFIFKGALFQLSRNVQVYLQKSEDIKLREAWRPSVVCISEDSFQREEPFYLLSWIAHKYGFGTYIHRIDGYYSKQSNEEARNVLKRLIEKYEDKRSNVYIDTLISPSYTSAIAQVIQLPGISGMENNMILFEFDKANPENLDQIVENIKLVKAGNYDVGILGSSHKRFNFSNGIHVWIKRVDYENANLMILLSYIIISHPDWRGGKIRIFEITKEQDTEQSKEKLIELMKKGRIPVSEKNIEIIKIDPEVSSKSLINQKSENAGLTIIGFHSESLKHDGADLFKGYDQAGDVLFVNASLKKHIE